MKPASAQKSLPRPKVQRPPLDLEKWREELHRLPDRSAIGLTAKSGQLLPRCVKPRPPWLARHKDPLTRDEENAYILKAICAAVQAQIIDPLEEAGDAWQSSLAEVIRGRFEHGLRPLKESIRSGEPLSKEALKAICDQLCEYKRKAEQARAARVKARLETRHQRLKNAAPPLFNVKELASSLYLPGDPPTLASQGIQCVVNARMPAPADRAGDLSGVTKAERQAMRQDQKRDAQKAAHAYADVQEKLQASAGKITPTVKHTLDIAHASVATLNLLTALQASAQAYYRQLERGKKPTAEQARAAKTLEAIGQALVPLDEAKARQLFGNGYSPGNGRRASGTAAFNKGCAAVNALAQPLSQKMMRISMLLHEMDQLTAEVKQQGSVRPAQVALFKRKCQELCSYFDETSTT